MTTTGRHKTGSGSSPEIWVLCGSARFQAEISRVDAELAAAGRIAFSYGGFGHSSPDVLRRLSDVHREKIRLATNVFVVNVDGYIGGDTRREIEYARELGRQIVYLVPPPL